MGKRPKNITIIPDSLEQDLQNNGSGSLGGIGPLEGSISAVDTLKFIYVGFFSFLNTIIMAFVYFILIFQTIYILNEREPKYINLRHIAIKWLIIYFLQEVKRGYSQQIDINGQLTILLLDLCIVFIAYPSRILKTVHLKYFSRKEQQKFQSSVKDPKSYDITFGQRLLIAIVAIILNFTKHLIAFVPPDFRKPIEEPIKNINKVMIERKCFWSIYEDTKQSEENIEKEKKSMVESILPQSLLLPNQSNSGNSSTGTKQIKGFAEQCSVHTMKPIKKITIKYNPASSELEIMDLDFGRAQTYILQQLIMKESSILEFKVFESGKSQSESIIAKFKNGKQAETFLKNIEEAELNL